MNPGSRWKQTLGAPIGIAALILALGAGVQGWSQHPASASTAYAHASPDSLRVPFKLASDVATAITMQNVDFHAAEGVVLRIRRLAGEMRPVKNGVVDFDDINSYVIDVKSAEVGLTGPDLTNLMNHFVFAYKGSPLSHLRVTIQDGELRQTGTLHKGVDIPFDMVANVSLTPDGRIMLRASRVRILGVNGLALMKALGLSLEKMMDLSHANGVSVKGNDLVLDGISLLPPPRVRGRLSDVRIVGDRLVQTIGQLSDSLAQRQSIDPSMTNYMLYRGGTLHFGKLFMTDAEMFVVDADPSNAFDFDNPNYHRQLIAGHSRTLPDLGLEVWMPDASSLARGTSDGNRSRPR
jgi:hypothetical protein